MTSFLDTSVLVAVFYGDHAHHQSSFRLFVSLDPSTGCCGAHSLVEVYATLTRMPGRLRVTGEQALLFLKNIEERLSVVALDAAEYSAALRSSATLGILGGTIYDAMLAHCALKADPESIYTWNVRHYQQCGPEILRRLKTPNDCQD